MDFGSLLPPRSVEDILAERVRLTIGGEVYDLPVLSLYENAAWKERCDRELAFLIANISTTDDLSEVLEAFDGYESVLMDLLRSYDTQGVLPDHYTMVKGLTPLGLFKAVIEVWRAARPLAAIAAAGLSLTPEPPTNSWPQRLSSWLRNMAGRRDTSGAN